MTCRKVAEYNGRAGKQKLVGMSGSQGLFAPFATEADCLQACKEGACCEGTTCSVKPQCQCQGAGKTFKGVGTTCSPNPCDPCVGACAPNPTHPISLTMTISGFSGPQAAKFQINTSRQISRSLFFIGTQTCWAYNFGLLDIGDQCPNPLGQQVIDGYSLNVIFSMNEGRFFANYKDIAGQCKRYDIYFPLTTSGSSQARLCSQDFPFTGTVNSQGVSFSFSIAPNPLP